MKYSRILAEFHRHIWALREETLMAMASLIHQQATGAKWNLEEIRERIATANLASGYLGHENLEARFLSLDSDPMPMQAASGKRNAAAAPGSVCVIPVTGILSHRMSLMSEISGAGGGSIQALTAQFRQAMEDGNCKAVVLDIDSPGGSVEGIVEFSDEIFNARKQKPITAIANCMAASAAYWLCSAASEVVISPSGQCGSIGVYMVTQDESEALKNEGVKINLIKAGKYKAEGHPSEPLTDEARDFLQGQVDSVYGMFVKSVAKQRGVSQATVRDGMGQGRSLLAQDAVKANLADRTGTLDDVLEKYGAKKRVSGSRAEAGRTLSAKLPSDPDEEDDDMNENACSACKACSGSKACECATAGCACACDACKACDFKDGSKAVLPVPQLSPKEIAPPLNAEEQKAARAAAGDYLAGLRRRQRQLALL